VFTSRFATELPNNGSRVMPTPLAQPYWVCWNQALADTMQLPLVANAQVLGVMSGTALFQGHDPIAQKYAGHQFGGWNPGLGDGRGLLLGEWLDPAGVYWEMHLKGAGKTPYSRFGDGRAVLRSSIREFLGSEALHGLGAPSTRALALAGSSEQVYRETLESGATLMRVASSHIRFGHFEWLAYCQEVDQLKALTAFTIKHHFPGCQGSDNPTVSFLHAVVDQTARMIAYWMAYGFVHGVMNTDNMSIVGETFDYGPYAFLDETRPNAVYNHTDAEGRYAFNQQPSVALWNLQRLAQALAPLTEPQLLAAAVTDFDKCYRQHYYHLLNQRLGGTPERPIAPALLDEWLALLAAEGQDFHIFFRRLANLPLSAWPGLEDDFIDAPRYTDWCRRILEQTEANDVQRQHQMLGCNPVTVARSHHLQTVIAAAQLGDFGPLESLFAALQEPFSERTEWREWHQAPAAAAPPPNLSCSS
jgi:uncharacterized protein YdiU (UPF0061 family)